MSQNTGTKTLQDVIDWTVMQFGDSAGVQIDVTKMTRWANMAVLEVVNKSPDTYKGKAYTPGGINTQTYTFPANVIELFSVWYGDKILSPIQFELIADAIHNVDAKGEPQYWSQWANEFQLWPIPNVARTITLFYSARPPELTSLADKMPLPDRYFPMICTYVMSKAQELDEDYAASSASRQVFEDKLKEISHAPEKAAGSYAVMDDPDWWDC